ncbi:EAL domain-containing protein [Pseudocolwellia sp. HL-MZ7]|uniref:EAL domain-containing protein n=1 Tax=Pseudocolwellia sp. HL-MZ7 TaxID=3400627 RepID=UPI003CED813F
MHITSFFEQANKAIKLSFLLLFIASISTVLWLVAKNLWVLGDYQNMVSDEISIEYQYLLTEQDKPNLQPPISQQHLFINKEGLNSEKIINSFYWVKLNITNKTDKELERILHVDALSENIFSYYQVSKNDTSTEKLALENSIFQHMFPHFSFTLPPNESVSFFIQLKTNTNRVVPVNIYDSGYFDRYIHSSIALFGAFIGIVLLVAKDNVALYVSLKDRVNFTYAAYLICTFLVFSTTSGFGYLLFSNDFQLWLNQQTLYFQYALNIYLIIFSLYFLQDRVMTNKAYKTRVYSFITAFILLVLAAQFIYSSDLTIFLWLQPLLWLFGLLVVCRNISKKFVWAKFYYISWLPYLAGSITQYLISVGYIECSFVGKNAFILGVIAQVGFIALALTERMRKNEQDKLHHLSHHIRSGLPRQLNLTNAIKKLSNHNKNFSVIVIQPEHIQNIQHYVDDLTLFALFKRFNQSLSSYFKNNTAIIPITLDDEKLSYIQGKCIGFVVNLDELTVSTEVFIQNIQDILCKAYTIKDLNLSLTGVIGIAHSPEHGSTGKHLIKNAILAIIEAQNTPEKWATYAIHTRDSSTFLLELASDIQHALRNKELQVYHQPQIDLKTSKVCGSECLIRWDHPTKGFISPSIFIPVAEDMGLINKITLWVLEQSLAQHTLIMEDYRSHMVSINISGINLTSKGFYQEMLAIVDKFAVPTEKIIFEITESANIAKNEHAVQVIDKFTSLGIKVSIDDFGTGYSSLANLDKLPFQELKIDQQFVENIHNDDKRRVIAETTVKMAKGVGLEVVAEGLTTAQDEATLTAFGCDIGQGYYYSEALPIKTYLEWLSLQVNGKTPDDFHGEFIPKKV